LNEPTRRPNVSISCPFAVLLLVAMASSNAATPPVSLTRLKQIADDACAAALTGVEYYEHAKTEAWNTSIINAILRSLISESSPPGGQPGYKYAVNSTIIQHLVPSSALNKSRGAPSDLDDASARASVRTEATGTDGKPHVGRRGMHSATGAYWNEKTDGMWSYKHESREDKGLDVVISVIWIGI